MKKKVNILITAGPTREYLDPVRFISNGSSGKMGFALAEAAKSFRCNVILICGPVSIRSPKSVKYVPVISADDMFRQVKLNAKKADIIVCAAAVSDYSPVKQSVHKLKKSSKKLILKLAPTVDILKYAGKQKKNKVLVGFALESKNLCSEAKRKLREKNLDLIVSNYPENINKDKGSVVIFSKTGKIVKYKNKSKKNIAKGIINEAIRIWKTGNIN